MISIHICKDAELIKYIKSINPKIKLDWIEMYSDFDDSQREQLYQKCRLTKEFPMLILSVFTGSSILNQLPILEKYKMDIEVCRVSYSRLYSEWIGETRIEGSLS